MEDHNPKPVTFSAALSRRYYRAVVKYDRDATRREKVQALEEGVVMCVLELAELGVSLHRLEDVLEEAHAEAEEAVLGR